MHGVYCHGTRRLVETYIINKQQQQKEVRNHIFQVCNGSTGRSFSSVTRESLHKGDRKTSLGKQ